MQSVRRGVGKRWHSSHHSDETCAWVELAFHPSALRDRVRLSAPSRPARWDGPPPPLLRTHVVSPVLRVAPGSTLQVTKRRVTWAGRCAL